MRDAWTAWSQPISLDVFVCNIRHYLGKPERRWRPSTFWLMRYLRSPVLCSCSRDMWVRLGRASSNVVLKWGVSPLSSIVHTPLGPLMNTNSTEITNTIWLKYSLLSSVSVFLRHILKNLTSLMKYRAWCTVKTYCQFQNLNPRGKNNL